MKKFIKTSKLENNYIVYDLETFSRNPYTTEPIEIGAIVIDCNTLQEKENGRFASLVKPTQWELIQDEALAKNKITREMLETAPEQKLVMEQFVGFCRQFTRSDKLWDQLIPCGYNIVKFDNIIMDRMCEKYDILSTRNKEPNLFHPFHSVDLAQILRYWFHNTNELPSYSLTDVCEYFGLTIVDAHRALADVEATMKLLQRFMKFGRELASRQMPKMKGCFSKDGV